MLKLSHVSKMYEGAPLLREISFTVGPGETTCMVGPSGSGKTTLLKLIAGLEPPDSGTIFFNGVNLKNLPPHSRDFGLVFQDYGLFPHLNVFENIAFGLRMHRCSSDETRGRVMSWLKRVNLDGFEERSITDLSGGEQQRVALARALAPKPRLLMLDEPLGALDRNLKEGLLDQLRRILRESHIPAIYVTHDQEEALTIADRVMLLHDGRIVRDGTPLQVYGEPGSAWAAKFLNVGNVMEGVMIGNHRVRTSYGVLPISCGHDHPQGQTIPILVIQNPPGRLNPGSSTIRVKVEEVLFRRDGFEIRDRKGISFHVDREVKIGRDLEIGIRIQCLHEGPEEKSRRRGRLPI